ncbi:hypothetical protein G5714_021387 [Onychostoma macrolepis]|uniref:Phosphatidylinositol-glycan biosynthesis class X protein n=1 Tax=Onychostoma macrolepis TaxID=369639 RepID=A0A7J6BQU6_9TELE|nr:hypothetical protein G5714_021387 [Onychostoma macrolepis]
MSVKISKAGFHRDLQYRVQWSKTDHDVQVLLVQKLPSGVYMDEYQLETLRRDTGLEVLLDSKVDLEAPEYLSSGFTALVFLSGKHEAVVPVHGRYHRPSDSSKRVKVDIESPRLLLRSDQCTETLSPGLRRVVVDAPCTFSNHSICSWMEILDLEDNAGVSLEIPASPRTEQLLRGPLERVRLKFELRFTALTPPFLYLHLQTFSSTHSSFLSFLLVPDHV